MAGRVPAGTVAWGALLAVAGALEVYGIRNPGADDTLSEFTRRTLRTRSRAGRVVFTVGWALFAGWFFQHITTDTESGRSLSS